MILQMLAKHSTHAKHAPATPPAAPAPTASPVLPSAASAPAAASPAPAAPAQQHAMIQLATMIPPRIPQTLGSAVCGALLPMTGTLTGGATAGNGASGTFGRAPATVSVAPVKPLPSWFGTATAVSAAWLATGISGAWLLPSVAGAKPARTKPHNTRVVDMFN